VEAAINAASPFDFLAKNADTNSPEPFTDVTMDDCDAVKGLNVKAAFFLAQHVARRLLRRSARVPSSMFHRKWGRLARPIGRFNVRPNGRLKGSPRL
jgi:NAD(P)-dependent dehydrogenase (short-subunit alcohol dehydrogenase family)